MTTSTSSLIKSMISMTVVMISTMVADVVRLVAVVACIIDDFGEWDNGGIFCDVELTLIMVL